MINVDKYLDREYDRTVYNCGHFVVDVYLDFTGIDLAKICAAFTTSNIEWYAKELKQRVRLDAPETPCIAMIKSDQEIPHVGVYVDGRILHLTDSGASFDSIDVFIGKKILYYK